LAAALLTIVPAAFKPESAVEKMSLPPLIMVALMGLRPGVDGTEGRTLVRALQSASSR
jgi:hypothetical protein